MMYLIVGRSGTGKSALLDELAERGVPAVVSYTTRPRRSLDEQGHRFITEEELAAIPESDRIAATQVAGYRYFALKREVARAGAFVLDPYGVYDVAMRMPDTEFTLVYVSAPEYLRSSHAVVRADDIVAEENVFKTRDYEEYGMFTGFERRMMSGELTQMYPNITNVIEFVNDYDPERLESLAEELAEVWHEKQRKLEPTLKSKVRDEYLRIHGDKLGESIDPNLTYGGLVAAIEQGKDVYDVLGVGDSIIREAAFTHLSTILDVPYKTIHDAWIAGASGEKVSLSPTKKPEGSVSWGELKAMGYTGDVWKVQVLHKDLDENWEYLDVPDFEAMFCDRAAAEAHARTFTAEMAAELRDGLHPTVGVGVQPYTWENGQEIAPSQEVLSIDYLRLGETVVYDAEIDAQKALTENERRALAQSGMKLDRLLIDPSSRVRSAVADQGYGLDVLIDDPAWPVRERVAAQGFGLERLVADECAYVRRVVAAQGYGLNVLINDPNNVVANTAAIYLRNHGQLEVEQWSEKHPEHVSTLSAAKKAQSTRSKVGYDGSGPKQ